MEGLNREFVIYPLSSRMKALGFDEPCLAWFVSEEHGLEIGAVIKSDLIKEGLLAPTWQSAFRWFRENYNLVHEISWSKYKGGLNFDYDVFSLVLPTDDELGDEDDIASDKSMETYDSLIDKDFRHKESDTYEEAELACLTKLIEIVESKVE
jgi:hypothetical protein